MCNILGDCFTGENGLCVGQSYLFKESGFTSTRISLNCYGNNRRFVSYLLRGKNKVVSGSLGQVSCLNLFLGLAFQISIGYCSTHNIKSIRNQLHALDPKVQVGYYMTTILCILGGKGSRNNGSA